MASAHRAIAVTRDGHAVIHRLLVAIDDEIGLDVRVLRAGHFIALSRDAAPIVVHSRGCGDYTTAVVSLVTETDKVSQLKLLEPAKKIPFGFVILIERLKALIDLKNRLDQ